MDTEQRDQLRDRNRARAWNCDRCGHTADRVDGAQLDQETHFAGVEYKVCRGCGYERVIRHRRKGKL